MSNAEKNIYFSLVSVLLVTFIYCLANPVIFGTSFIQSNDTALAGKSIFLLMVACVIVNQLLRNTFAIVSGLRQAPTDQVSCELPVIDERDKLIELSGMQLSYAVFSVGFVISLLALWAGWSAVIVLHMIIFSLIIGEVSSCAIKIIKYRRGF